MSLFAGQRIAIHDHSYSRGSSFPTHLRQRVTQVACRLDRTPVHSVVEERLGNVCALPFLRLASQLATRNSCNRRADVVAPDFPASILLESIRE